MVRWYVYGRDGEAIEMVKEGFNWWAFLFVGIWALFKGLYVAATLGLLVALTASRMPPEADIVAVPILLALMLLFGFQGNRWVCAKLERSGYSLIETVEAASLEGARARYKEG